MNDIERAIDSTKNRIHYITENAKDGSYSHCVKADKQEHIQNVILSALEKQTPKQVIGIEANLQNRYCPSCNEWMFFEKYGQAKYCPTCGQALDWTLDTKITLQ